MRGLVFLLGLVASGCFDPTFPASFACDQGRCPPGYRCGDDDLCRRDALDAGRVVDGGQPDATPVTCEGEEDCANPENPCLLPGPCEDGVCNFTEVDCSHLDGECTAGVCEEGTCEARAVRQDQACGDGLEVCGGFGGCGGFADDCDESGTRTRSCTDSTCQAGECVTGAPYDDTEGCARDTDGVECMATEVSDCADCSYVPVCANDGPPRSCTCTYHTCAGGACTPSAGSCQVDDCHRDSEGQICNDTKCCTANETCGSLDCL